MLSFLFFELSRQAELLTLSTGISGEAIAYGNNKFVVVGDKVGWYSEDGVNWVSMNIPSKHWTSVAYTDRFVIVGEGGSIAYSKDLQTWTEVQTSYSKDLYHVIYSRGKVVAVGNGIMLYSEDNGVSWKESVGISSQGYWTDVAAARGYVKAIDYKGKIAYTNLLISVLPKNHNQTPSSYPNERWYSITSDGDDASNHFVVLSKGKGFKIMCTSDNGGWEPISLPTGEWKSVEYVNGYYILFGEGKYAYSTDLNQWTSGSLGVKKWYHIAYGNGKYVVIGNNEKLAYSNYDVELQGENIREMTLDVIDKAYGVGCKDQTESIKEELALKNHTHSTDTITYKGAKLTAKLDEILTKLNS